MKQQTKDLKIAVLETAAELIRGYLESGIADEIGFPEEKWHKEADKVYEMLMKKAAKYED